MPIKLTLERVITRVAAYPAKHEWGWRFRQSIYTREPWETFDIPAVCGVAGVYVAYLPDCLSDGDEQDIESWKDKLKDKALQELQETRQNIQQKIDGLGDVE